MSDNNSYQLDAYHIVFDYEKPVLFTVDGEAAVRHETDKYALSCTVNMDDEGVRVFLDEVFKEADSVSSFISRFTSIDLEREFDQYIQRKVDDGIEGNEPRDFDEDDVYSAKENNTSFWKFLGLNFQEKDTEILRQFLTHIDRDIVLDALDAKMIISKNNPSSNSSDSEDIPF